MLASPNPLDRPVWHALTGPQAPFATTNGAAVRLHEDVGPFAAAIDDSPESLAALAALIPAGGSVVLLQADATPLPPGTRVEMTAPGVQMVGGTLVAPAGHDDIVTLGDADVPAMLELTALTRPGPFAARTNRLGHFRGVRIDGRLAAMAGERMRLDGFTEVSGVCTHPDFRGRGLAGLLSYRVARDLQAQGVTPFLHAFESNTAAIGLYETLGFRLLRAMTITVLARD
jgi:predicted GNAT family acetyltransferase